MGSLAYSFVYTRWPLSVCVSLSDDSTDLGLSTDDSNAIVYRRDIPDYMPYFCNWRELLASAGYVVVSPNYRGSESFCGASREM